MDLKDKVALVTGGANGIGLEISIALLRQGAKVSICDVEKNTEVLSNLSKEYGSDQVTYLYCDVTKQQLFQDCFEKTIEKWGRLDIVVNNAGINCDDESGWEQTIYVNFEGVVRGTKLGLKYLHKDGIVVNMGSLSSVQACVSLPVYSATKAAVNQFSRSIGSEFHCGKKNLRVIAINPGVTRTRMMDVVLLEDDKLNPRQQLLKQLSLNSSVQKAEDVARGLIKLLGSAGNGTLWTIHGGNDPVPTDLLNKLNLT